MTSPCHARGQQCSHARRFVVKVQCWSWCDLGLPPVRVIFGRFIEERAPAVIPCPRRISGAEQRGLCRTVLLLVNTLFFFFAFVTC